MDQRSSAPTTPLQHVPTSSGSAEAGLRTPSSARSGNYGEWLRFGPWDPFSNGGMRPRRLSDAVPTRANSRSATETNVSAAQPRAAREGLGLADALSRGSSAAA